MVNLLTSVIGKPPANELEKMRIDCPVALAAGILQPIDIKHVDMPAPIAYQPCLLQIAGDQAHAGCAARPTFVTKNSCVRTKVSWFHVQLRAAPLHQARGCDHGDS